jgi:ketosteroid isomerase-like protein
MPDDQTASTLATVERFNLVFNEHDVDRIMATMTEDCVFENTYPPPEGERYENAAAVRSFWERLFRASPKAHFATEEIFACQDRCVTRWLYTFVDQQGNAGRLRGVDIFRVRDGKVSEKLSYVKG